MAPDVLHPDHNIGPALRWLRTSAGLQQKELAATMERSGRGVSTVWLSQVETGRRQPSWTLVTRILNALNVSPENLTEVLRSQPWHASGAQGSVARTAGSSLPTQDTQSLARELAELNAIYFALPQAKRAELLEFAKRLQ